MENYIVSARKYRPSTFASVVGQHALTATLKNAIKSQHIAHAYLFCGPRGVGKTTCARILAKTINCQHLTADIEACNECESCRSFNEQRSYNIHELDAASNNSVEDIRKLIEQVRIPPQVSKYSIYIVDEVHMLSKDAFNAFLKTLEEPPAHAIFILATTEKHKILPTILSRCQIYDFNRITINDITNHLKYVAQQEGIEAETEALNVVAQKAEGGMRDALSIFDQLVSSCGNRITYQQTIETLNVLDYDYYFRMVECFMQGNVSQSLLLFNEILNKGFDAQYFISGLSSHFRDVLVSGDPATTILLEANEAIAERYKQQAKICPPAFIFRALDITSQCEIDYRTAKNKRLLVEIMLIRLCQLNGQGEKKNDIPQLKPVNQTAPATAIVTTTQPATPPTTVGEPAQPYMTRAATTTSQPAPTLHTPPATQTQQPAAPPSFKPLSISISTPTTPDAEQPAEQTTQLSEEEKDMSTPFTENDLLEAWLGCTVLANDNPRLTSIIQSTKPKSVSNERFEVEVATELQERELKRMETELLKHIHKQLRNNHVSMRINIAQETEKKMAFTAEEKYDVLLQKNPVLKMLKDELGLQIE